MGKIKTSDKIISKIVELRSMGNSISEISLFTGKSKSIVSKYIQGVKVLPEYRLLLKRKQGGSKFKSENLWNESQNNAQKIIKKLELRDKIFLLVGIYWGEGTKRELNIINSDPVLLLAFINFIKDLESNLRIVDISSIQFSSSASGVGLNPLLPEAYKYDIKIKTYWLKN